MKLHSQEKMVILAVVVCGLVAMLGTSFAYFISGGVSVTGEGSKTNVKTADFVQVFYDAGELLTLTDAYPSKSASKNFHVKLVPTVANQSAKYAIKLNITSNGFTKCTAKTASNDCAINAEELVYTLKDQDDNVVGTGDLTGITGEVTLYTVTKTSSVEATYNYNLEIAFKDTNADQNHNVGKSLAATVEVQFSE